MNFEEIGLNGRDKRVYEALIEGPGSSVRRIADMTGINRGSVFESIKQLVGAGLVSYKEKGERRHYQANDPEILHELINERRRKLKSMHVSVDDYIALLPTSRDTVAKLHFASFYEGDEGLAQILRDVLTTCRVLKMNEYSVISSPRVSEYLYNNFPHYTRERIKQGLSVRILRQGKGLWGNAELSETRILPGAGDTGCYMIIYGSKVAQISIDKYNVASGVVIDNADIASIQETLFLSAWDTGKSI